jgi:hypothetical protein
LRVVLERPADKPPPESIQVLGARDPEPELRPDRREIV